MKKWRKWIWLLLVMLVAAGLSGCSSGKLAVQTEVMLQEDGSGSRQMVIEIGKNEFEKIFSEIDKEEFDNSIIEGCPSQLTAAKEEEDDRFLYTITLQFSSIEEYQKKASAVIGENAEISFFRPESVFADGIQYEENFSSLDLIGWLEEILISKNYLDEETVSGLFVNGASTLIYGEKNYKADGKTITVNDMTFTPVERIDILTNYLQNKSCNRQIIFTFSKDSMNKNGDAIQAYLLKKTPDNASGEWIESGDNRLYTITAGNMSAVTLNEFMVTLFQDTDTFVNEKPLQGTGIFTASYEWNEVIDTSAFTYDHSDKVALGYYVQWEDGMDLTVRRQNAEDDLELEESDRYGGYQKVLEENIGKESLVTSVSANYIVERIEVNTVFDSVDVITRDIILVFQMNPGQDDLERIRRNILQKASGYADVLIKDVGEDEKASIQITQKGNLSDVNEGYRQIFGVQGQTSHEIDGDLMAVRHDGHLADLMDFTEFIENDVQKTLLVYHLELPNHERITADSILSTVDSKYGTQNSSGNEYDAELPGAYLSLTLSSKAWNRDGLKLLLVIIASVAGVILLIVLAGVFSWIIQKLKTFFKQFNSRFGGNDQNLEKFPDETKEQKSGILKKILGILIVLKTPKVVPYEEEQYMDDNLDEDSYFGDIEENTLEDSTFEEDIFEENAFEENTFEENDFEETSDNQPEQEEYDPEGIFEIDGMPEFDDEFEADRMFGLDDEFELDEMSESDEKFDIKKKK